MINIELKYWKECAESIFLKKIWADQELIIAKQDVINAYNTNKINSSPFQTDYSFGYNYHVQRIAYFMGKHILSKPITIENYIHKTNIQIIDGKHRLAAAYLSGKTNINAISIK